MMNKNNEDMIDPPKPVVIRVKTVTSNIYTINLFEFDSPERLSDLYNIIYTADSGDQINLHLNNPGGYLASGIQLISAFEGKVDADVNVYIDAPLYSMAALFATRMILLGYKTHVNENSYLMFHNYSGGAYGKGNELYDQLMHDKKWYKGFFERCTIPFLTQAEVDGLCKDQDVRVWYNKKITGVPSILQRLKRLGTKK